MKPDLSLCSSYQNDTTTRSEFSRAFRYYSIWITVPKSESVIFLLFPYPGSILQKLLLGLVLFLFVVLCLPAYKSRSRISRNKCRVHPIFPPTVHYIFLKPLLCCRPCWFFLCVVHSSLWSGFSLTDNLFSIITVWLGNNSYALLSITCPPVQLACQSCHVCWR